MNKKVKVAVLTLCAIVFLISAYKVVTIIREYATAANFYDDSAADVIKEVEPVVSAADDVVIAPFTMDFDTMLAMSEDFYGWIYLEDSMINYPVARSRNNSDYLHRLLNGRKNQAGTIFLDCESAPDLSDGNSIIYGHNMNDGSMFAGIRKYMKAEYYDTHKTLWLLTPERPYRIDVIAGYVTDKLSDAYNSYNEEGTLLPYLQYATEQSAFETEVDINSVEHVLTLSTCTYERKSGRYVLVGKIVPAVYPDGGGMQLVPAV